MIHRIAALALGATLLHLNFVRADSACATHEHAPTAKAPVAAEHHDHAAMEQPQDAQQSDDHSDCDVPAQQDCCQAVTACSTALDFATHVAPVSVAPPGAGILPPASMRPVSRVTTPDPPPPRA